MRSDPLRLACAPSWSASNATGGHTSAPEQPPGGPVEFSAPRVDALKDLCGDPAADLIVSR